MTTSKNGVEIQTISRKPFEKTHSDTYKVVRKEDRKNKRFQRGK